MKKRLMALVMACTMLFTVPAFAGGMTKAEAKKAMDAAEAAIQGVKRDNADALDAVVNTKFQFDRAERELENARKDVVGFTRPSGMSKSDAEKKVKALKTAVKKAEKVRDFWSDQYKDAQNAAKDAQSALDAAFIEWDKYRTIYETSN